MDIKAIKFKEKLKGFGSSTHSKKTNQIIIDLPKHEKLTNDQKILLISFLEKL